MIDLRSDVKTVPTERMRRAMMEAEVGDDLAGEDPTVNRLEDRCAELLGKEAALLVNSGTQGNLVVMMALTEAGQMFLCHRKAHVTIYEQGSLARICGLLLKTLPGKYGAMAPDDIEAALPADDVHHVRPGLLHIENPHNLCGGTVITKRQMDAMADVAHANDVPVHVDGARIFDAAVALDIEAKELVESADSVQFCFTKSLGAPMGSIVAGSRQFIEEAARARKVLGGASRQAGVIAAPAMVALDETLPRLKQDHEKAKQIAETLVELPGIGLDMDTVQTNMVYFTVRRDDMDASGLCERLAEYNVTAAPRDDSTIRLVTHRDVSDRDTKAVCAALDDILSGECG